MKQAKLAMTIDRLRIDLVASIIVVRSKINKHDFDKKMTTSIAKRRNLT